MLCWTRPGRAAPCAVQCLHHLRERMAAARPTLWCALLSSTSTSTIDAAKTCILVVIAWCGHVRFCGRAGVGAWVRAYVRRACEQAEFFCVAACMHMCVHAHACACMPGAL